MATDRTFILECKANLDIKLFVSKPSPMFSQQVPFDTITIKQPFI